MKQKVKIKYDAVVEIEWDDITKKLLSIRAKHTSDNKVYKLRVEVTEPFIFNKEYSVKGTDDRYLTRLSEQPTYTIVKTELPGGIVKERIEGLVWRAGFGI